MLTYEVAKWSMMDQSVPNSGPELTFAFRASVLRPARATEILASCSPLCRRVLTSDGWLPVMQHQCIRVKKVFACMYSVYKRLLTLSWHERAVKRECS